jgi:hypothetical protein
MRTRNSRPFAPTQPDTATQAGDSRLTTLLRCALEDGRQAGHRVGYVQGWRWGVVCGVVITCLCTAVMSGLLI